MYLFVKHSFGCNNNNDEDEDGDDDEDDEDDEDDDDDDDDDDEALATNVLAGDNKLFAAGSTSAK